MASQEGITFRTRLQRIADCLSEGFQCPEVAAASIALLDGEFTTDGFYRSPWALSVAIRDGRKKIGEVCVICREERPEERPLADQGPFLREEKKMLHEVARQIALLVRREQTERKLREAKERAEQWR